jgi:hypothetical protein
MWVWTAHPQAGRRRAHPAGDGLVVGKFFFARECPPSVRLFMVPDEAAGMRSGAVGERA